MLAQDVDSLIYIKGYYVTRSLKQEIVFSYEKKIKKERGESYATPIDNTQLSFFVPVQIGEEIVCEEIMIMENFLNHVQNDSIYYIIPHRHYNDFLKTITVITTDASKAACVLSEYWNFSPYYEVNENNEFLFKCIYIEGYALHKYNQEFDKKKQDYLWSIFQGNKYKENREFFFIVKINNYTPYIEIQNLKKWLPYLE
jgi:hypothetical protein